MDDIDASAAATTEPGWSEVSALLDRIEACMSNYTQALAHQTAQCAILREQNEQAHEELRVAGTATDAARAEHATLRAELERQSGELVLIAEARTRLAAAQAGEARATERGHRLQERFDAAQCENETKSGEAAAQMAALQTKLDAEKAAHDKAARLLDAEKAARAEAQAHALAVKQELARERSHSARALAEAAAKNEAQLMRLGSERAGANPDLLRQKIVSLESELAEWKQRGAQPPQPPQQPVPPIPAPSPRAAATTAAGSSATAASSSSTGGRAHSTRPTTAGAVTTHASARGSGIVGSKRGNAAIESPKSVLPPLKTTAWAEWG